METNMHGTTIIAVRRGGQTAVAGDGQVTLDDTVMKAKANKIRKLYDDKVLAGFSGATADAFTLFEMFEEKLEQYKGNMKRSAVEMAKTWRSDRVLRRLDALMIVADKDNLFLISGNGDVLAPDDDAIAIGSGGPYALAAARSLLKHSDLSAAQIAREAVETAAEICIYTNTNITVEEM